MVLMSTPFISKNLGHFLFQHFYVPVLIGNVEFLWCEEKYLGNIGTSILFITIKILTSIPEKERKKDIFILFRNLKSCQIFICVIIK